MTKIQVKISSNLQAMSTKINLEGKEYLIDSDNLGNQNPEIITRIFLKGKIVYSCQVSYKEILNSPDLNKKLLELIERQQNIAIEAFKKEIIVKNRIYEVYISEAETLLKKHEQEKALQVLTEALKIYPNNPIILSYQGLLEAVLKENYSKGITNCNQALKILKEQMPLCDALFLPIIYLNLGRVYLAADKKKEAFNSFKKGVEIDNIHEGLICELEKLGMRRRPLLPLLKRSNPLNKYFGKLIFKLKSKVNSKKLAVLKIPIFLS
jgi:tetratricopeptide (TPR) repeat protein